MRFALALVFAFATLAPTSAADQLPVDGTVVQQVQWTTNGAPGEHWLAVLSRTPIMRKPLRYQYELSFLRPRSYLPPGSGSRAGYARAFVSPGIGANGDFLTKFTPGLGIDQEVSIVGIYQGYLVVQKHESAGDCGSDEVAFFSEPGEGDVEKDLSVVNHCSLNATIVGTGNAATVVFQGPQPGAPHAKARLVDTKGHYHLSPSLFQLTAP